MDVPLEILDREVARAEAALEAARARHRIPGEARAEAPNPLEPHRRVSSRDTWLELAGAPGPLAAPLRAWVGALTLERVLWADTARLEDAWRAATITVAESRIVPFTGSPRDLLVRTLGEADPGRQRIFAGALERGAGAVHDAARILAERRVEATRLLGADLDAVEIPVEPRAALVAAAARILADTGALLARGPTWSGVLARSVGRDAGEGWPARLGPRWLSDLFLAGPLTEGLQPAIAELPAPIGASSFARALGAFGAALADADGPRTFFSVARAPFDLRRARRAALFAGLAADPVFASRALGLGRGRARDQSRDVARGMLVSLRLDAARALCRGVLSLPGAERVARFEEHTAVALGAPIPPALAGVVPRLGPGDPTRLASALLAAGDRRRLVERFDEDWFRSPHACRAIREEDAAAPPQGPAPAAQLDAGIAEIIRVLGELG